MYISNKWLFFHKSSYGIKRKNSCLFQCTVVPCIPEFSPDSRMLSLEDADVTMRVYFFQSEVDFAEVTREKVKFGERCIMEARKA